MRKLPFSHYADINNIGGGSAPQLTLVEAMPGCKISLRGILFTCVPASSVSGLALIQLENFSLVTPEGETSGKFDYFFLPSTTAVVNLQFDYPEGTVETQEFNPALPLLNNAVNLYVDLGPAGSDQLEVHVNYWGYYVPCGH